MASQSNFREIEPWKHRWGSHHHIRRLKVMGDRRNLAMDFGSCKYALLSLGIARSRLTAYQTSNIGGDRESRINQKVKGLAGKKLKVELHLEEGVPGARQISEFYPAPWKGSCIHSTGNWDEDGGQRPDTWGGQ
ncbi:hypothetical protein B0H11DRAFT_1914688 [Mycena galericulata]|nr:hypothetical protein B0H11DRAFT_1914688 [Mycena galericulata]